MNIESSEYDLSIRNCHIEKTCLSHHALTAQTQMRIDDTLCDACIHLDCGSMIRVHRIIMSSACEYFRALFTSPLNVIAPTDVHIKGIRLCAMQAIVDFAYTRSATITDENVTELIAIAHYIGLSRLEDLCANHIQLMLTPENCVFLWLELRHDLYDHELDGHSKTYILRNFLAIAECSEQLMRIPFDLFFEIVADDRLNVKAEEPVWECCLKWIDQDVTQRLVYVKPLLSTIRLGLMSLDYFVHKVKEHPYVVDNRECNEIIVTTLAFMYDLNTINVQEEFFRTPPIAIPRLPHDVIFVIGGWSGGQARSFIEVYDTRADRWMCLAQEDPFGVRAYHGTVALGHQIYCIGGYDGVQYFNSCTVFDAKAKTWKEIAPMHSRRCYVSVAAIDGLIYALGGHNGVERLNTAERYDPRTNQWTMIATMLEIRSDSNATVCNGKIIVVGGFNGLSCLNTAESYDPATNVWTLIEGMHHRRSGLCAISKNNEVYVIGGFNGTLRLPAVEKYTPENNSWSFLRPMNSPRSNFAVEIIDDMIFVIGGFDGRTTVNLTECYNPETNEWLEATNICHTRSASSAVVLSGLSNVADYLYRDRELLLEERRLFNHGKLTALVAHRH